MIIFPMAGKSSRFFNEGYSVPKFMLTAKGKTLFEHAVLSFAQYFESIPFLFITNDSFDTKNFVSKKCIELNIKDFSIVVLNELTRGQAETVKLGLDELLDNSAGYEGPITIFNIDTLRLNFKYPSISSECDAYIEVFRGEGDHWSFAKGAGDGSTSVIQTAEKDRISDLCSTGLYHFNSCSQFINAFIEYSRLSKEFWSKGELYIAPLYNILINDGLRVNYHLISSDEVSFFGTPHEYCLFKNGGVM